MHYWTLNFFNLDVYYIGILTSESGLACIVYLRNMITVQTIIKQVVCSSTIFCGQLQCFGNHGLSSKLHRNGLRLACKLARVLFANLQANFDAFLVT